MWTPSRLAVLKRMTASFEVLSKVRRSYGLPEYQAHDALTDALAAAELFLVLRNVLHARTLRDLR